MSSAKYDDLIPEVLPALLADPSAPLLARAIKQSVIQFCQQSRVWKFLPDPIDVVAGEAEYEMEPEPGADVVIVAAVTINGSKIEPRSTDQLDSTLPGWRAIGGNAARYWTQTEPGTIIIYPSPTQNIPGGLVVSLVQQPKQNATTFPKWIFDQYSYVLAAGALSRLMLMPGRPWTDLQAGAYYRQQYEQGIADAKDDGVKGLSRAAPRTSYQH